MALRTTGAAPYQQMVIGWFLRPHGERSLWGKIICSITFTAALTPIGGPVTRLAGLAAGLMVGHLIDRATARAHRVRVEPIPGASVTWESHAADPQLNLLSAIAALGAKVAKADGTVTRAEVAALRRRLAVPSRHVRAVGRAFNLARAAPFEIAPLALKVADLCRDDPARLEWVLDLLFEVAHADGPADPVQTECLRAIGAVFLIFGEAFEGVRDRHGAAGRARSPYALLGIGPEADDAEVKAAYRRLVWDHHPDRLAAKGVPPEFMHLAHDRMAAINGAYDTIAVGRGWRRAGAARGVDG